MAKLSIILVAVVFVVLTCYCSGFTITSKVAILSSESLVDPNWKCGDMANCMRIRRSLSDQVMAYMAAAAKKKLGIQGASDSTVKLPGQDSKPEKSSLMGKLGHFLNPSQKSSTGPKDLILQSIAKKFLGV